MKIVALIVGGFVLFFLGFCFGVSTSVSQVRKMHVKPHSQSIINQIK